MALSIFEDKENKPDEKILAEKLAGHYEYWNELKTYIREKYPKAEEQWNFSGKKYGWSFRMRDKKRVITYFIPCDAYFKTAFVYGKKATDDAMGSSLSKEIKEIIQSAKVYAEGRGFRVDFTDKSMLDDIKLLIDFKLKY